MSRDRNIAEKQESIISDFDEMEDAFDRYAFLTELGCMLPAMDESKKTEDRLVKGCQSHVWLDIHQENGLVCFDADSDTLIIRGVLYLLKEVLEYERPEDVCDADLFFLRRIDVIKNFSDGRQKGIGFVVSEIKKAAALMCAG